MDNSKIILEVAREAARCAEILAQRGMTEKAHWFVVHAFRLKALARSA